MTDFPRDVSFIQEGRELEVQACEGGRQSNQFSSAPARAIAENAAADDDEAVGGVEVDDIQETQERVTLVSKFVPHAKSAFADRGLDYPFTSSRAGDSLEVIPGFEALAERTVSLSECVSQSGKYAKQFELRAARALHRLIGGWCVCVGWPRTGKTSIEDAIREFRDRLMDNFEKGHAFPALDGPAGDLGADAFLLLGRMWGGPIFYLQVKNAPFDIENIPEEFNRISQVLFHWFGKRIGDFRAIIPVFGVNTMMTQELKARAYQATNGNSGLHIVDAVDIIAKETFPDDKQPCIGEFWEM